MWKKKGCVGKKSRQGLKAFLRLWVTQMKAAPQRTARIFQQSPNQTRCDVGPRGAELRMHTTWAKLTFNIPSDCTPGTDVSVCLFLGRSGLQESTAKQKKNLLWFGMMDNQQVLWNSALTFTLASSLPASLWPFNSSPYHFLVFSNWSRAPTSHVKTAKVLLSSSMLPVLHQLFPQRSSRLSGKWAVWIAQHLIRNKTVTPHGHRHSHTHWDNVRCLQGCVEGREEDVFVLLSRWGKTVTHVFSYR